MSLPLPKDIKDIFSDNQENYDSLIVAVESGLGELNLLLAVCDDIDFRDEIINRYETELKQEGIEPYRNQLNSRDPSLYAALYDLVSQHEYLKNHQQAILTITGTDKLFSIELLDDEISQCDKFLGYLQWTREGLRDFPFSVVLWVSNKLYKLIAQKAPDFYSWRGGVFFFTPPVINVSLDSTLIFDAIVNSYSLDEIDSSFSISDLESVIEQTKDINHSSVASLYRSLGDAYKIRLDFGASPDPIADIEKIIAAWTKAIDLYQQFNHSADLANTLDRLASLYHYNGDLLTASSSYKQSLTLYRNTGDLQHEAETLNQLAILEFKQVNIPESIELLQQSLEIHKRIKNSQGEADILNQLGSVMQSQGSLENAIEFYRRSLKINRQIDNIQGEALTLSNLAIVAEKWGDVDLALNLYEQSLAIYRKIGNIENEASILLSSANVRTIQGELDLAIDLYQQAMKIYRSIGNIRGADATLEVMKKLLKEKVAQR
jgi:tetratricopeptide (TPR) repeat protein